MHRFKTYFFILIIITIIHLPITSYAEEIINIDKVQEDIIIEKISNEVAFDNLINKFRYSHTEAEDMINEPSLALANQRTWIMISYYGDPNVVLRGQAKVDSQSRIRDVAPRLIVEERAGGCDITNTGSNRFSIAGERSVRFELEYRIVCGIFPSWQSIDEVTELAPK